jgi:hypothetical protein
MISARQMQRKPRSQRAANLGQRQMAHEVGVAGGVLIAHAGQRAHRLLRITQAEGGFVIDVGG